ncbi:MAG: hypothetical protein IKC03_05440 [Oscillospiraceae bacterium]|nr:hypothetical protein [Oscillospiraceae bacterium]MBR4000367.1 hypothetical protein [Clostridia bacterium]
MKYAGYVQTNREEGVDDMEQKKDGKQNQTTKEKKLTKPGEIKGKLEVPDTRERRDGPGGN